MDANSKEHSESPRHGSDGIREAHPTPHSYRALGIWKRSPAPEKLFCTTQCLNDTTTCSATDQSDTVLLPDSSDTRIDRLQSAVVHTKGKKKTNTITETFFSIYGSLLSVHDLE